jgi:hypothetical protein
VEHEIYDYTGNNWSHRTINKGFKEKNWKPLTGKYSIDSVQKITTHHTKYGKYAV